MKNVIALVSCTIAVLSASFAPRQGASGPASSLRYNITELGVPPGYTGSEGHALNASGQAVGYVSKGASHLRACLWEGGRAKILGTLGDADSSSEAYGINASGDVVGYSYAQGGRYAFVVRGGQMTNLGALGSASDSEARAINSKGQVCGYSQFGDGSQGFLHDNGEMVGLGSLGGVRGKAWGINTAGHVVGETTIKRYDSGDRAFLWKDGKMSDITPVGSESGVAQAINDTGQTVGFFFDKGRQQYRTFLYSGGTAHDLGVLPGTRDTRPKAINNRGQIVGFAYGDGKDEVRPRACLYQNGKWRDLNDLLPAHSGWRLHIAWSINGKGQIVGDGTHNGQHRGFLLTPHE